MVVLREGAVYIKIFADGMAGNLLLKAGDELVGTQGQGEFLAFAALKGDAVDESFKIEDHIVAHLSGTVLYRDGSASSLLQFCDLRVHILIGDGVFNLFRLDALVALDLDLGLHSDGGFKGKAVFADFQDLDIRTVHRGDPCFFGGRLIGGGVQLVDRVLKEHALTVHFLNHMPGRFALAETGNGDGRGIFPVRTIHCRFEFLGGNADLQFHQIGVNFFGCSQTHLYFLL